MGKLHTKRHTAPKSWHILRKAGVFITTMRPGAHNKSLALPLSVILKDVVNVANSTREVKRALHLKQVLVDGTRVKDHKKAVGVMDTIHVKDEDKSYRISINDSGRLFAVPIKNDESSKKVVRVIGKTRISKSKTQLNLQDSRNILVEKDDVKVGDSLLIEVPSQKIVETLKLEEGATIMLTGGKHMGYQGKVLNLHEDKVLFETKEGKFTTSKKYSLVIGKAKPAITIA